MALSAVHRQRWQRFCHNRRGYWSLWLFLLIFLLSLAAELLANEKPLLVRYQQRWYVPLLVDYSEQDYGGVFATAADYQDPWLQQRIAQQGWALWAPIRFSDSTINFATRSPFPSPPSAQNWLGTDASGGDVLARLLYGTRVSLLFGLLLCVTQFLVAPVGWLAGGWTASFGLPASFRPLVYMACIAVVSGVEMALLYLLRLPWKRQLLRILPLAALNSCVLGTLLLGRTQNFTLTQALGFGLGSGVGYLMAVLLVTEAQNRLRSQAIPSAFRGMPITLIYIGVLALAIYGFTGHTVIL